jgi:hypothetical protein
LHEGIEIKYELKPQPLAAGSFIFRQFKDFIIHGNQVLETGGIFLWRNL